MSSFDRLIIDATVTSLVFSLYAVVVLTKMLQSIMQA